MPDIADTVRDLYFKWKKLRELTETLADQRICDLVTAINRDLGILNTEADALKFESSQLKDRIKMLETQEELRRQLIFRGGLYWFSSAPPDGRAAGPYCTGCLDASEKLVVLREMPNALSMIGKYECPVCERYFG